MVPETQSQEKLEMLRASGAKLIKVPAVRTEMKIITSNFPHGWHKRGVTSRSSLGKISLITLRIGLVTSKPRVPKSGIKLRQIGRFCFSYWDGWNDSGVSQFLRQKRKISRFVFRPSWCGFIQLLCEWTLNSRGSSITEGLVKDE